MHDVSPMPLHDAFADRQSEAVLDRGRRLSARRHDQRKKTLQDANRMGWLNVSLVIDDRHNSSHPFMEWSMTLDDRFSRAELNAAASIARALWSGCNHCGTRIHAAE